MPARGARHEPTHEQRLYKSSPRAPRPPPHRSGPHGSQRAPALARRAPRPALRAARCGAAATRRARAPLAPQHWACMKGTLMMPRCVEACLLASGCAQLKAEPCCRATGLGPCQSPRDRLHFMTSVGFLATWSVGCATACYIGAATTTENALRVRTTRAARQPLTARTAAHCAGVRSLACCATSMLRSCRPRWNTGSANSLVSTVCARGAARAQSRTAPRAGPASRPA